MLGFYALKRIKSITISDLFPKCQDSASRTVQPSLLRQSQIHLHLVLSGHFLKSQFLKHPVNISALRIEILDVYASP